MAEPAEHPLYNTIRAALVAGKVYAEPSTLPLEELTTLVLNGILAKVQATEAIVTFGWFYKWGDATKGG